MKQASNHRAQVSETLAVFVFCFVFKKRQFGLSSYTLKGQDRSEAMKGISVNTIDTIRGPRTTCTTDCSILDFGA